MKKDRRAMCLVLELNTTFPATLSAPVLSVAVDGDRGKSLESQFHQKVGKVYRLPCPVAKCLKLALYSRLCSEWQRLGSEADQSST